MEIIYFEITKAKLREAKWFAFKRKSVWVLLLASLLIGTGLNLLIRVPIWPVSTVVFIAVVLLWWVSVIKMGVPEQLASLKESKRLKGHLEIAGKSLKLVFGDETFEITKYKIIRGGDNVYFVFRFAGYKSFILTIPKSELIEDI